MKRIRLLVLGVMALLLVAGWASDFLTLQGERTVYTAACEGGEWRGGVCAGRMIAGHRYRYRASKENSEVVFQLVGSSAPAVRLSNCTVLDGRNWSCRLEGETVARSWTARMEDGVPVVSGDLNARSERRVSKWRWFVLDTLGR